jgi:hypothetical protein
MSFEVTHALRNLDERTPEFFRRELFAHGDLTMRRVAIEALTKPSKRSVRILCEILRLVPGGNEANAG